MERKKGKQIVETSHEEIEAKILAYCVFHTAQKINNRSL
jgi:hypothetical protein